MWICVKKKDLEKKTVEDLRKIAKELKVKRWYELRKCDLIESIMSAYGAEGTENDTESKEGKSMCNHIGQEDVKQKSSEVEEKGRGESKLKHLQNIKRGTIVAFKTTVFGNERVKSAAVDNVSQKRQMLKLKTAYGKEFTVPFSDVIWVRTGSRWPKGVYELLKGVNNNVGESR